MNRIVVINDVSLFSTSNKTLITNERDVYLLFMQVNSDGKKLTVVRRESCYIHVSPLGLFPAQS